MALVDDEIGNAHERIKLVALTVIAGTHGPQSRDPDARRSTARTAPARRPATARSTRSSTRSARWCRTRRELELFQVHAVTEGTDAQAEVSVRLAEGGRSVTARGADPDTLVACARAYLAALNKLTGRAAAGAACDSLSAGARTSPIGDKRGHRSGAGVLHRRRRHAQPWPAGRRWRAVSWRAAVSGPCNPSTDRDRALASLDATLARNAAPAAGRDSGRRGRRRRSRSARPGSTCRAPATPSWPPARASARSVAMTRRLCGADRGRAGPPSAFIIAGTGVAGHRLYADGRSIQRDAWGWVAGDRGSGAWLGRAGLRHCLAAIDGVGRGDRLSPRDARGDRRPGGAGGRLAARP